MLGKPPYPIFTQFVNALRGLEMREDNDEQVTQTHLDINMAFVAQRAQGRDRGYSNRGQGY